MQWYSGNFYWREFLRTETLMKVPPRMKLGEVFGCLLFSAPLKQEMSLLETQVVTPLCKGAIAVIGRVVQVVPYLPYRFSFYILWKPKLQVCNRVRSRRTRLGSHSRYSLSQSKGPSYIEQGRVQVCTRLYSYCLNLPLLYFCGSNMKKKNVENTLISTMSIAVKQIL